MHREAVPKMRPRLLLRQQRRMVDLLMLKGKLLVLRWLMQEEVLMKLELRQLMQLVQVELMLMRQPQSVGRLLVKQ